MKVKQFPSPLHFHPELEILLVIQGAGTRFVGNSVEPYFPGDLVIIGENVPHVWYTDNIPSRNTFESISEAIYIQFNKEIFGKRFWELPGSKNINKIFEQSLLGIKLTGKTRDEVNSLMKKMVNSSSISRITSFLSILEIISMSKEYHLLASPIAPSIINQSDSDRLNKVYKFVVENFQQEISLDEVASLASFSTSAFCRYFKARTNKTFIQFLNEIRMGHACRLLVNENNSITEICHKSGFNNISYFIKQFKRITGQTPLIYRKKYLK